MAHVFEPASSGRAKCRGCGRLIQKGELRFGERMANPFGDGEITLWFHPLCAAFKRPEPVIQTLSETPGAIADREALERAARSSMVHRRVPRIDGAERASSGRATCRSCRKPIDRGAWRIRLVFFEEGRFSPGGYVHLDCRSAYFETADVLDQVLHFSLSLSEEDREELRRVLGAGLSIST